MMTERWDRQAMIRAAINSAETERCEFCATRRAGETKKREPRRVEVLFEQWPPFKDWIEKQSQQQQTCADEEPRVSESRPRAVQQEQSWRDAQQQNQVDIA